MPSIIKGSSTVIDIMRQCHTDVCRLCVCENDHMTIHSKELHLIGYLSVPDKYYCNQSNNSSSVNEPLYCRNVAKLKTVKASTLRLP